MSQPANSKRNSKSSTKPSLTAVRKILREATFNPRKPGTMQVVSEQGSSEYYEHMAIVAIQQAQETRPTKEMEQVHRSEFLNQYRVNILQAIKVLVLALFYTESKK